MNVLNGYFHLVQDKKQTQFCSKSKDFDAKQKIWMLSFLIFAVIKLSEKTCQILGLMIFKTSVPHYTISQKLT